MAPAPGPGDGGAFAGSQGWNAGGAALIAMYRRRAQQYERDAAEAETAAEQYAEMSKAAIESSTLQTPGLTFKRLNDAKVNEWARADLQIERLMNDPRPAKAAVKSMEARVPYDNRFKQFLASEAQYGNAARGYGVRATADLAHAKQLMAYANQQRLEGDAKTADLYVDQAVLLGQQAAKLKNLGSNFANMESKIHNALPQIETMAEQAQKFAAWKFNPLGAPGVPELWTYTVAPPLSFGVTTPPPFPAFGFAPPGGPAPPAGPVGYD